MNTSAPALAALLLGSAILSPVATSAAEETEVFKISPPRSTPTGSGFDEDSVARIEPGNDKPLTLKLRDLPPHQFLKIDAVLDMNQATNSLGGIIRIFDGAGGAGGVVADKDIRGRLQVKVDGGDPAVDSSFGSMMGNAAGGSFPDRDGDFLHAPGTGSTHGPLAANDPGGRPGMARFAPDAKAEGLQEYRVAFVIPHTGSEAEIEFGWVNPNAKGGAGAVIAIAGVGGVGSSSAAPFSVKNLTASVVDAPVELDADAVGSRYEALGSDNPTDAVTALYDLVAAGRGVLPLLADEIHRPGDPDLEKKFAGVLKAMDDESFETRAAAAKTLSEFGADVIPLARRTLAEEADSLSVEVKNALEGLTDRIEKGSGALATQARANRLHRLLDLMGGDDAAKLKASLPEPKLVVAPALATVLESGKGTPGVIEMDFGGIKGVDGGGGAVFKFEAKGLRLEGGAAKLVPAPEVIPAPAEEKAKE